MSAFPMPARRGLFGLAAATALTGIAASAAIASLKQTPLGAINQRIHSAYLKWSPLDEASTRAYGTPDEERLDRELDDALQVMLEPRTEAAKHQAVTIDDLVIQATIAFYMLESVDVRPSSDNDVHAIQTMLASMIRCLAKHGNVDMRTICQEEMGELADVWAPGGRGAA
jgi:hypothetical protein